MQTDAVIRAENLGKRYLIGHSAERERYVALRDVIARTARGLGRSAFDIVRGRQLVAGDEIEEFWALKGVSFEVKRGEVIGIIGRNGAGKSTLLKVLSRITEPTAGRVELRGRVASLLEVGTGFHPELTGRENIFLNGAILGMTRVEINRRFDAIVAFAEVEKFLDTPVKRYSSGMYVRLAFAVAAHLESEILIIDEVLAVGDAEFQRKCLGKMRDVAGHGRTVLFVSHNLGAVERLCRTAILLTHGRIGAAGAVTDVIGKYQLSAELTSSIHDLNADTPREGAGTLTFVRLEIWGHAKGEIPFTGGRLNILMSFDPNSSKPKPSRIGIVISTQVGVPLIICSTEMTCPESPLIGGGDEVLCQIPELPLTGGHYYLTVFLEQKGIIQDWRRDACLFHVREADFFGYGRNAPVGHEGRAVLVRHSWRTTKPMATNLRANS